MAPSPHWSAINTDEYEKLNQYFEENVRGSQTWLLDLVTGVGKTEFDVDIKGVKVAFPSKLVRNLTSGYRYRVAARAWLRPHEPVMLLKDLPGLRKAVGLDHIEIKDFTAELKERCTDIQRGHAPLHSWVEKRNAVLDFQISGIPHTPEELRISGIGLRQVLTRAIVLLTVWKNGMAAAMLAEQALERALESTSASPPTLSWVTSLAVIANLMVPISLDDWKKYAESIQRGALYEKASKLWEHQPEESQRLVWELLGKPRDPTIQGSGCR